jgi:hypothetical protein
MTAPTILRSARRPLNVDETTYRGTSLGRRRGNNEKFPLFVFEIAMALRHFRLRCEIFPRGGQECIS